ncbi:MAG: hypothetical protein A4E57_02387 [Syntrophorhabdaceae bacterium PtaU1.Bin034]|nr:MAG: hypothetical protein A4E57_02387 [Syntrophorhabdaceae bacterium PtaU1.Bin034]
MVLSLWFDVIQTLEESRFPDEKSHAVVMRKLRNATYFYR